MVIYINSKNRLQIKSINFNIFTYSLELYEKLTFKKCFVKIPNDWNMFYGSYHICKNLNLKFINEVFTVSIRGK